MNIYGLTFAQLEQYLLQIGEKISKAPIIFTNLYRKQIYWIFLKSASL